MTVKGGSDKENHENVKMGMTTTLDDAMMITGLGIYNIMHMLLNGVILMGVIMLSLAMGYILPAAQCDLNLTTSQMGLLAAIPFLAIILMSICWGWLADTRGRRPVMLYTMLLAIVCSIVTSFAPNTISFAILMFITCIFASGCTAIVYAFLGEFNTLQHRDKMVAFGSSFVGIGTVVLPGISWLILPLDFAFPIPFLGIEYRPWRLLVVACAIPYVIGSIFMYFSPESPKFLHAMGQDDTTIKVLRKIYAVNKWTSQDSFPVHSLIPANAPSTKTEDEPKNNGFIAVLKSLRVQTVPLFKLPLLPWTLLTCFVQFGLFATTNGFYVWFPTILNSLTIHEGTETKICDILESSRAPPANGTIVECDDTINTLTFERSIYIGLIFSSMYVIVGFLIDFVGKKIILIVILVATGACGIGAHLAGDQQTGVILFAVFQMSGACIGLMNAVAVDLFPTKFRAMAVCLAMMMGRVGSMVGSNLIGFLLTSNCGVGFYLFGGIIIMNGICCLTLPGKKSGKDTKTVSPTQCQTHEPA